MFELKAILFNSLPFELFEEKTPYYWSTFFVEKSAKSVFPINS
jgi:hypothetical protein